MTDADLIYNALLRAELRLQKLYEERTPGTTARAIALTSFAALSILREEIGNGLAQEGR